MLRSAYALGGLGSGIADSENKLRSIATAVSVESSSPVGVIFEVGWVDRRPENWISGGKGGGCISGKCGGSVRVKSESPILLLMLILT